MTDPQLDGFFDGFADAAVAGDRAALEGLLGPDFEFVSAEGRVFTRDRRLDALTAGGAVFARLEFTDRSVRAWGSAAILRARFLAEFHPDADGARTDQGVSTLVLLRGSEGWRICHQHNSHLSAEQVGAE